MSPPHSALIVEDTDLEPAECICPVCGWQGYRETIITLQHEPLVVLLSCPHCGGASASRLPSEAFLQRFYKSTYGPAHIATTQKNAQHLTNHIVSTLAFPTSQQPKSLRLIDFGGNDGSMALSVAEALLARKIAKHIDILVIDFIDPVASSDPRISISATPYLSKQTGCADIVLASAVLEHIPRLAEVIPHLLKQLAPQARFYARTSYMAPLAKLFPSIPLLFPAHVHDLGVNFWDRIAQTFGLPVRVVTSRPSVVETRILDAPLRTIAAHIMKFPARLERRLMPHLPLHWKYVGGWEVLLVAY